MRLRKRFKDDSDDEDEQALITAKFKGRCNKCGKFGHKAKDCRLNIENDNKKNNPKKKFSGKCFHCGKLGHREADCWSKHGKPEDRVNTANESEEEDNYEEVLISMEDVINLLLESHLLILDKRAYSRKVKSERPQNMFPTVKQKRKTQKTKQRRMKKLSQVLRRI